jgi:ABC-type nitrate/sulfonate/bicarbonate transport system substrate-binding protein
MNLATGRERRLHVLAVLVLALLLAVACGGGGGGEEASGDGERSIIRFAFSPDPVIDYLNDTGKLVEFEERYNTRLVMTSTWDEFTAFAGGHADIVSMATYEAPVLEQETDIQTVTFGKYNALRITPVVRADSDAQTLADLEGEKIGVPSAVSSTLVWGMYAKKLHNLDFRVGRGDFELVVEDHFVMPELVMRGELAACLCIPEAFGPYAMNGEMKVLYDGQAAWEIFRDKFAPGHVGLMGNNFIAVEEWYDSHPKEVEFFLALWEEGLRLWEQDKEKIIAQYPQHFAIDEEQPEAGVKWFTDYLGAHDWFVDTVYLDKKWIDQEKRVFDLMKETGFMAENAEIPRFEVTQPE